MKSVYIVISIIFILILIVNIVDDIISILKRRNKIIARLKKENFSKKENRVKVSFRKGIISPSPEELRRVLQAYPDFVPIGCRIMQLTESLLRHNPQLTYEEAEEEAKIFIVSHRMI